MRRVRSNGVQRLVHILQEFEEDGTAYNPVRSKAAFPRGWHSLSISYLPLLNVTFLQLMAMNVVPRLVLDDA